MASNKSKATVAWESRKKKTYAWAEKVRATFFSPTPIGAALWALAAALCIILLIAYFISPLGLPAAPVYEGF